MSETNQKVVEQYALNKIPQTERQSWGSIALIWVGSMICVPSLMIGGLLVSGLTVTNALIAGVIGYLIVVIYMCFQGMQASDTGLPTVSAAAQSFGKKGSRIVISLILGIACLGWFGFQANVCGSAFSGIMASAFNLNIPIPVSSFMWGIIMLITAIYGFNALKYLNYIAVPSLILVSIYGVFASFSKFGTEILMNYTPPQSMSMLSGIAMTVGSFALGGVIAGDYSRYAKNRKDVVKSSVFGVIPAGFAMITMGGIMSLVSGTYDISIVLTDLGVPAFGLIALILATWTTNTINAYSGGLAITNLFNLDDSKRSIATAVAGIAGTLLAVFGIINYFVGFLSLLTSAVPPVAGIMIAEYWIVNKGEASTFTAKKGIDYAAVAAWLIGSLVAIYFKWGIQPVNGIVVSMVIYLISKKISK
jgi:cytosine permease